MKTLILARHGHAGANAADRVSSRPPGEGLSPSGVAESLALREALAGEELDLGVATELVRTQETLELALGGRDVPRLVLPRLNEIGFGRFEGGPLEAYRQWAWTAEPDVDAPGRGESRTSAAARYASALEALLAHGEETILAVAHALPIRYVLDASDGRLPAARVEPVAHAAPYRLAAGAVETAAETLRAWSRAATPRFAERSTPNGGREGAARCR